MRLRITGAIARYMLTLCEQPRPGSGGTTFVFKRVRLCWGTYRGMELPYEFRGSR